MSSLITKTVSRRISRMRYTQARLSGSGVTPNSVTSTQETAYPITLTDSLTGGANPHWRRQVRARENATTFLDGTKWRYRGGYGSSYTEYYIRSNGINYIRWASTTGCLSYCSKPTIPTTSSVAESQASLRLYKNIKKAETAIRGLTVLGELKETLRMLRNPAKGLRRGLDDYLGTVTKRARGRQTPSSRRRLVSETWLEYVFGWSPLISDIHDAGQALNRRLERYQGSYTKINAEERAIWDSISGYVNPTALNTITHRNWKEHTLYSSSVRYYGLYQSVCPNPVVADVNLFGVSWRDIAPTAWELIPYSFLVDYFTNIGDVLDAWSVRHEGIAWLSKTIRNRVRRRTVEHLLAIMPDHLLTGTIEQNKPKYASGSFSSAEMIGTRVIRNKSTAPSASFALELPGFSTKWINMSALLAARNRTRKQLFR